MAVIDPTPAAACTAKHATTQRKIRSDVYALLETRGIVRGATGGLTSGAAPKSLIYIRRVAVCVESSEKRT